MKMSTLALGVGIATAGFVGYMYLRKKDQALSTPIPGIAVKTASSTSPSTSYPFQVPQAARQDNVNQPWTQAPRPYSVNAGDIGAIGDLASSVGSGISDMWDSMFGADQSSVQYGGDLGFSDQAFDSAYVDTDSMADSGGSGLEDYGMSSDTMTS